MSIQTDILARIKAQQGGAPAVAPEPMAAPVAAPAQEMSQQQQILQKITGAGGDNRTFDKPVWDPEAAISYEDESPLALTLAGIGKGGANVYKNVANMLGFDSAPTVIGEHGGLELGMTDTTDEGLYKSDEEYAGITDTTAGSVGEFVGEGLTLAVPGLGIAGKASKLPTAMRVLTSMGEGALGGAILSDPNSRGAGALLGAGTGGLMTGAGAMGSRFIKDGLAKVKEPAKDLLAKVKKFTTDGKEPSIPLSLAADIGVDSPTSKAAALSSAASMLPSAKAKMERQAQDLAMDVYEANIGQAFGKGKAREAAVKTLRESGDMTKALEAGKNAKRNKTFSHTEQILYDASRKASGGRYTPTQLRKAAEDAVGDGDLTNAPFRETAMQMESVLPKGADTTVGTSNVAARDFYHNLGNAIGLLPDAIPMLGETLGSQRVQNFLMGSTKWQKVVQEAVASKNGQVISQVMTGLRRAVAAQAGPNEEYLPEEVRALPQALGVN